MYDYWNTYYFGDIRVVSPLTTTERLIDGYYDDTATMYDRPEFKNLLGMPLSGIFLVMRTDFPVGASAASSIVKFNIKDGVDGVLSVSGIFDFGDADTAYSSLGVLQQILNDQAGVTKLDTVLKGPTIEFSGELGTGFDFTVFMNIFLRAM